MTTQRITDANLQAVVDRINRLTGSPAAPHTDRASNIGNFHLDHAYGGVALYRMANTTGGCDDVLRVGHVSKRELYHAMFAFIEGIEIGTRIAFKEAA